MFRERSRNGASSVSQYHSLYQNAKRLSKAGENFCKELMAVFQQRYRNRQTAALPSGPLLMVPVSC